MSSEHIPETHFSLSDLRVRYAETDAMGIVHNSVYLTWFEVGRTDLSHKIGYPYAKIEQRGINYPLVEGYCRYRLPARYDDRLIIKTWIHSVRSRAFVFDYEIHNHDTGQFIANGYTKHMVLNKAGRAVKLPDDLYRIYCDFDVARLGI